MALAFLLDSTSNLNIWFTQGDVSLSAEDKPPGLTAQQAHLKALARIVVDGGNELKQQHRSWIVGDTALKYLLAGGIAGACMPRPISLTPVNL